MKGVTRLPQVCPCPECGANLDAASGAGHDEAPTPDDVTLCLYCGAWLAFAADLSLRALEPAEIETLPQEAFDMLVKAGEARAVVMRSHPKAR